MDPLIGCLYATLLYHFESKYLWPYGPSKISSLFRIEFADLDLELEVIQTQMANGTEANEVGGNAGSGRLVLGRFCPK